MPLSGHVYCVAVTCKMTEQWICIKFCIKLKHSPTGTIWVIQKATAMGSWWLAVSSQQCIHSHINEEFFGKTSNCPGDSHPYSPDLVPCDFWLLLKLKSPLKGKRRQTVNEIQENMTGQLMAIRRTVWGPKVPNLKGTEASLSYVQWFLYVISSSRNVSIFILHGWIPSVQTIFICSNKTNNKKSLFFKVIPELITISSRFQLCPQGRQSSYLGLEQKDDNALRYVQKHQTESPDFYQPQE